MQKLNLLVKALIASTAGLSIFTSMSAAKAINLVPQQEGEIQLTNTLPNSDTNNGVNCLPGVPCIDTTDTNLFPFAYTVTSLAPSDEDFGLSRLFSDSRSTANNFGFGISFTKEDEGTNAEDDDFWFRPVAVDSEGQAIEGGRLEFGIFKFDFLGKTANEVKLSFLDVEDSDFSGVLKVNGEDINPNDFLLPAAGDGEVQNLVLRNVDSFVVQLGNENSSKFPRSGDGVNLQVSVPEPGTIFSMGALAVAGMFGLRKRNKSSNIA